MVGETAVARVVSRPEGRASLVWLDDARSLLLNLSLSSRPSYFQSVKISTADECERG